MTDFPPDVPAPTRAKFHKVMSNLFNRVGFNDEDIKNLTPHTDPLIHSAPG